MEVWDEFFCWRFVLLLASRSLKESIVGFYPNSWEPAFWSVIPNSLNWPGIKLKTGHNISKNLGQKNKSLQKLNNLLQKKSVIFSQSYKQFLHFEIFITSFRFLEQKLTAKKISSLHWINWQYKINKPCDLVWVSVWIQILTHSEPQLASSISKRTKSTVSRHLSILTWSCWIVLKFHLQGSC